MNNFINNLGFISNIAQLRSYGILLSDFNNTDLMKYLAHQDNMLDTIIRQNNEIINLLKRRKQMDIEEIIQKIVDDGRIEDMHELSDILEDTLKMLEKYDKECYKEYEMKLYEMAYGQNLTDKTKIEWVKTMQPSAKWRVEEAQEIYSRYGIEMPFYSFFVIINMMFSDMNRVLGMGNDEESINKYIDATQDWYFDEDATNTQESKLYNYWKYIVN